MRKARCLTPITTKTTASAAYSRLQFSSSVGMQTRMVNCSVLFCSVLFCSVLFCSVLFCSVLIELRARHGVPPAS